MRMHQRIVLALAGILVIAGACAPAHAGSSTFEIQFNTSGLVPGAGGLLDMQLSAAYAPGSPSVSATIFNPITDGMISPGASGSDPAVGTAAGDLTTPGGVTMNNTAFSEIGQDFVIGSFFDIFVTLSGTEIGPGAVGPFSGTVFSFTVYDSGSGMESGTVTINPNVDGSGNPIIDGSLLNTPSSPNVSIIPEPSSVVLLGLGLGTVAVIGRLRNRRTA